jgi:hypothetical protein
MPGVVGFLISFLIFVVVLVILFLIIKWGAAQIGIPVDGALLRIVYLILFLILLLVFLSYMGIWGSAGTGMWWHR